MVTTSTIYTCHNSSASHSRKNERTVGLPEHKCCLHAAASVITARQGTIYARFEARDVFEAKVKETFLS